MKAEPLAGFAPGAYRDRIKAVELEAERVVQDALFAGAPAPGSPLGGLAAARESLRLYAGLLGRPLPEAATRIVLDAFASP